jgi:membrane-bound ClpP family serine protease
MDEAYDVHMTALGVSLLVVGAIMILAEAHVPTLGVLGGPGVAVLAVGAVLAVVGLGGGIALGVISALLLGAAGAGVVGLTVHKGLAVRRRRVTAGPEGLLGHLGLVRGWEGRTGSVLVDGALWRARQSPRLDEADGPDELRAGDEIVVEGIDGLTVRVRKAEEWELIR